MLFQRPFRLLPSLGAALLLLSAGRPALAQADASAFAMYQQQRAATAPVPTAPAPDAAAGPFDAAGPQRGGIRLPSFDDIMKQLRDNAMGAVKGCHYAQYIKLAEKIPGLSNQIKSLENWNKQQHYTLPFTDYLSMVFRTGGAEASRQSAKAETDGLVLQLEQACNAVAQADAANRQYDLVRAGSLNIGNALNFLVDRLNFRGPMPGNKSSNLVADWDKLYDKSIPATHSPEDQMWTTVSATLKTSLQASTEQMAALDKIQEDLNSTEEELILLAKPDSTTPNNPDGSPRFVCPTTYPDPNRKDVQWHKGYPVCGPASPERSIQITAHLELLKTQLKALEISNDSRMLEVEAIRLAADNQHRRVGNYVASTTAQNSF